MPIDPNADIEVTAFRWVPDFARGFVRDIRVRWALEEIDLPYRVRLIGGPGERPENYTQEQPFGQVPVYKEGDLCLFESGAIVIHVGEKDERLLPRDGIGRARAMMWVIAALNSIEPQTGQLAAIDVFDSNSEWGKLRRPQVVELVSARLQKLSDWLGEKEWLEGRFTIGDLMIADALRGLSDPQLLEPHSNLADLVARATARPAFKRAMEAQLADFVDLEAA